jgi:hypothetical protein
VPSPFAVNDPVQAGVPEQPIARLVANGPQSFTSTCTSNTPMPDTTTSSVIDAPGRVCCDETFVLTCGAPIATAVSAVSPQAVSAARTKPAAAIVSR